MGYFLCVDPHIWALGPDMGVRNSHKNHQEEVKCPGFCKNWQC